MVFEDEMVMDDSVDSEEGRLALLIAEDTFVLPATLLITAGVDLSEDSIGICSVND